MWTELVQTKLIWTELVAELIWTELIVEIFIEIFVEILTEIFKVKVSLIVHCLDFSIS